MLSAASVVLALSLAIFHESRSESELGQRAVAEVVINRMTSRCYPSNAKDVIFQRGQFSWASEKKNRSVRQAVEVDKSAWLSAQRVATETYVRSILSEPKIIGGATHFYSGAEPYWAKGLKQRRIGQHTFVVVPCRKENYVR